MHPCSLRHLVFGPDRASAASEPGKGRRVKLNTIFRGEVTDVADHTEDGFKVVDRRPFTAEGELRREVVEEQEREAKREEVKEKAEMRRA